jgi:hypothetical protein
MLILQRPPLIGIRAPRSDHSDPSERDGARATAGIERAHDGDEVFVQGRESW